MSSIDNFSPLIEKIGMTKFTEMMDYSFLSRIEKNQTLIPLDQENNFGTVYTSNLDDLGAKKDQEGNIIIDREKGFKKYLKHIKEFSKYGNLTFYPFHLIKPSDSSVLIHGLDFHTIFDDFNENNDGLIDFLNNEKKRLNIDEDIEIKSAEVIEYNNEKRLLIRIKKDGEYDTTMAIGYYNKKDTETFEGKQTLYDVNGNSFSPKGTGSFEYNYTDEQIKEMSEAAHNGGGKFMMNFYAWRSPEGINKDNYKFYHNKDITEECKDKSEEEINNILNKKNLEKTDQKWVLHYIIDENGEQKIILVRLVGGENGLWPTQDQIMPNFGEKEGNNETQKEIYKYWLNTYLTDLKRLIDNGVDILRIDLAHGFKNSYNNNDATNIDNYALFKNLIYEVIDYGKKQNPARKIFFTLETYDDKDKDNFLSWNKEYGYSAVKVYHTATEKKIKKLKEEGGLDDFLNDLKSTLNDFQKAEGRMIAASSFDDYALIDTLKNSGLEHEVILELLLLLGKVGYNNLMLDRDFFGFSGEIFPLPGGDLKKGGNPNTHTFSNENEVENKIDGNFEDSKSFILFENIFGYGKITGFQIFEHKIVFLFDSGKKRIFDFDLLLDGKNKKPFTEQQTEEEKNKNIIEKPDLNLGAIRVLAKIRKRIEELGIFPINVYNEDFWEKMNEFLNFVKTKALEEYKITDKSEDSEKLLKYYEDNIIEILLDYDRKYLSKNNKEYSAKGK